MVVAVVELVQINPDQRLAHHLAQVVAVVLAGHLL
jgi:hypothetical protein